MPAGHAGLGGDHRISGYGYAGVERGGVGPGATRPEPAQEGAVALGEESEGG